MVGEEELRAHLNNMTLPLEVQYPYRASEGGTDPRSKGGTNPGSESETNPGSKGWTDPASEGGTDPGSVPVWMLQMSAMLMILCFCGIARRSRAIVDNDDGGDLDGLEMLPIGGNADGEEMLPIVGAKAE